MAAAAAILIVLVFFPSLSIAAAISTSYHISCGAAEGFTAGDGVTWIPDDDFISGGATAVVGGNETAAMLRTLRYFPGDSSSSKSCFVVPVTKGGRYLIRTTYFYGAFAGAAAAPPVFDQIIDGTRWSEVDTAANYAAGRATYFEAIIAATGRTISVCVAKNSKTAAAASPFMSALEVALLPESAYKTTDFSLVALHTVARHSFGGAGIVDAVGRYWEPFFDDGGNPVVDSQSNVTSTDFWNVPPAAVFAHGLTASRGKSVILRWPPAPLPVTMYYLALYFQDNRSPSPMSWRVFDVVVDGGVFFAGLNVSTAGSMVYAAEWPLAGETSITLSPATGSPVGPVINAGELLMMMPLGGRTRSKDIVGMEALAGSFRNRPADWSGDPCLPAGRSWTGVTCSDEKLARVLTLNLTNLNLSGTISPNIANLTAITAIWLGGNNLTGGIPDMSPLKYLETLRLENNKLSGMIPTTLGQISTLRELYLQNNDLNGVIPETLLNRTDIDFRYKPGNNLN